MLLRLARIRFGSDKKSTGPWSGRPKIYGSDRIRILIPGCNRFYYNNIASHRKCYKIKYIRLCFWHIFNSNLECRFLYWSYIIVFCYLTDAFSFAACPSFCLTICFSNCMFVYFYVFIFPLLTVTSLHGQFVLGFA